MLEEIESVTYINPVGPCVRVPVITDKVSIPSPIVPHMSYHNDYADYKVTRFDKQLNATGRNNHEIYRNGYSLQNPQQHKDILPYVTSYYSRKSLEDVVIESGTTQFRSSMNHVLSHCSKTQLNIHTICNNSKDPAKCNACGKVFSCKCILKLHEKSHKGKRSSQNNSSIDISSENNLFRNLEATNSVEKRFSCEVCGKKFLWKSLLKRHLIVHTGEKNFRCDKCGKCFSQKSHLKTHELVHIIIRPFPCDKCGKTFPRISSLKIHKQVHSVEKNVHCGKCGKSFSRYANLKSHELIHSGLKPFHCGTCGKTFSRKSDLKTHIRTHTGERPFICIICEKRFSRKSILKRHELTHTGEKNFHCDICNKNFTRKSILKRHGLLHINEGRFQCEQCGRNFCRMSKLRKHEEIHVPENRYSKDFPITNYSFQPQ